MDALRKVKAANHVTPGDLTHITNRNAFLLGSINVPRRSIDAPGCTHGDDVTLKGHDICAVTIGVEYNICCYYFHIICYITKTVSPVTERNDLSTILCLIALRYDRKALTMDGHRQVARFNISLCIHFRICFLSERFEKSQNKLEHRLVIDSTVAESRNYQVLTIGVHLQRLFQQIAFLLLITNHSNRVLLKSILFLFRRGWGL